MLTSILPCSHFLLILQPTPPPTSPTCEDGESCGSCGYVGEGCCLDMSENYFSGYSRTFDAQVTMSAEDCKDICVNNITSCGLVGYEFGSNFMNNYCICLYDDGSLPPNPGGWADRMGNGTNPVNSTDGGTCGISNVICYSYTVSTIRVLSHFFRLLHLDQSHKDLCKPF